VTGVQTCALPISSELRAREVAGFIMNKGGIKEERLILHEMGEDNPLATNDDENEGREFNRRVELRLIYLIRPNN